MKSITEIKDSMRQLKDSLAAASARLDEVERDGNELQEIESALTVLITRVQQLRSENESNVDEVRGIKNEVEYSIMALDEAVETLETQENLIVKEVAFQIISNRSTGAITFRVMDKAPAGSTEIHTPSEDRGSSAAAA